MAAADGTGRWADELRERLDQLRDPGREDLFVLLLTWLRRHDAAVQDELRRLGLRLSHVEPLTVASPRPILDQLVATGSPTELAVAAVAAARALDQELAGLSLRFLTGEHLGIDDRMYRVRQRIVLEGVDHNYGAAKDDPVFGVARTMACVPVGRVGGVLVVDAAPLPEASRSRLARQRERRSLRVLVDAMAPDPGQWLDDGPWTAVHRSHDAAVAAEISAVLDAAAGGKVDLVILPELALCPESVQHLQKELRVRRARYPALTAVGLTHQPADTGPQVVNEAVLLDGRGTELLRHRKLVAYPGTGGVKAERLRAGDSISVLATPIGNLSLLICRDLFDDKRPEQALQLGYITWLFVPSLSPSTSPHLTRATALRPRWITTVVCNAWAPETDRGGHITAGPTIRPVTFSGARTVFEIEL
ncbi:MAG: nitrilase-related carbon-nitrogen hydrolase [Acidimicrobiales bacterium]